MRRILLSLALLSGLALVPAAHADTFDFDFSGAGGGFSGSAVVTGSALGLGVFSITDITGTGITSLISPLHFGLNDNLLYTKAANPLDAFGLSFVDVNSQGIFDVNIFEIGKHAFAFLEDQDGYKETIPITLSLSPAAAVTPEPSSMILLMTGLLGLVVLARKQIFSL